MSYERWLLTQAASLDRVTTRAIKDLIPIGEGHPSFRLVYYYVTKWEEEGLLQRLTRAGRGTVQEWVWVE